MPFTEQDAAPASTGAAFFVACEAGLAQRDVYQSLTTPFVKFEPEPQGEVVGSRYQTW